MRSTWIGALGLLICLTPPQMAHGAERTVLMELFTNTA